ncbi:hypothetical protein V8J36_07245 [Frigidibacter sp. MR17.14]
MLKRQALRTHGPALRPELLQPSSNARRFRSVRKAATGAGRTAA